MHIIPKMGSACLSTGLRCDIDPTCDWKNWPKWQDRDTDYSLECGEIFGNKEKP